MKKKSLSIDKKILKIIKHGENGSVFTPSHFLGLGSRAAVDQALSRHCRSGAIRRLARGLYDLPQEHPLFGQLSASTDAVAAALAGRDVIRLQPSGAYAANLLGLSDQVPVKIVYLTDGPSRRVKIGKREITLKHTTPRNMAAAGRTSGLIIQALRWLGRRQVDDQAVSNLRRRLSDQDKARLLQDIHLAPAWVGDLMRKVAQPGDS